MRQSDAAQKKLPAAQPADSFKTVSYTHLDVYKRQVLFWFFGFNRLHAVSINRPLARTRGIPVNLIDNIFAVLIAVIVTISIKWVGLLIINAMLILPAASSRNISSNMREYHLYSLLFSFFSGVTGLVVSYYANIPSGPMIVILASVVFFVTYCFQKKARD